MDLYHKEIAVCDNCRIAIANADFTGFSENEIELFKEGEQRLTKGGGYLISGPEEFLGFMNKPCDCCRDLPGDRWIALIQKPVTLKQLNQRKFVLVYQVGIANIFEVQCFNLSDYGREAKRIFQGTFQQAECICLGLGTGGHMIKSVHCNQAGDIICATWSENLEDAPFRHNMIPVDMNTIGIAMY